MKKTMSVVVSMLVLSMLAGAVFAQYNDPVKIEPAKVEKLPMQKSVGVSNDAHGGIMHISPMSKQLLSEIMMQKKEVKALKMGSIPMLAGTPSKYPGKDAVADAEAKKIEARRGFMMMMVKMTRYVMSVKPELESEMMDLQSRIEAILKETDSKPLTNEQKQELKEIRKKVVQRFAEAHGKQKDEWYTHLRQRIYDFAEDLEQTREGHGKTYICLEEIRDNVEDSSLTLKQRLQNVRDAIKCLKDLSNRGGE